MKYIRTKYGTIEENNPDIEREILAEADTIKELCDEFVIYLPKLAGVPYVVYKESSNGTLFKEAKDQYEDYKQDNQEVYCYGAIWTDKGLIYVAKLNDKGEWELL